MNNALKGGLLSALVFPGVGQAILKHDKRGFVLMAAVFIGMAAIVVITLSLVRPWT